MNLRTGTYLPILAGWMIFNIDHISFSLYLIIAQYSGFPKQFYSRGIAWPAILFDRHESILSRDGRDVWTYPKTKQFGMARIILTDVVVNVAPLRSLCHG